jgi:hypothetical protein
MQIRPLSVYFRKPLAKGNKVHISMQLSANAVYFDHTKGLSEKVFDTQVFTTSFTEKQRQSAAAQYFFDHKKFPNDTTLHTAVTQFNQGTGESPFASWEDIPRLALPPLSVGLDGHMKVEKGPGGTPYFDPQIELVADFAEVGDTPRWLSTLASLLKNEKSGITKALSGAADSALGVKSGGS